MSRYRIVKETKPGVKGGHYILEKRVMLLFILPVWLSVDSSYTYDKVWDQFNALARGEEKMRVTVVDSERKK